MVPCPTLCAINGHAFGVGNYAQRSTIHPTPRWFEADAAGLGCTPGSAHARPLPSVAFFWFMLTSDVCCFYDLHFNDDDLHLVFVVHRRG